MRPDLPRIPGYVVRALEVTGCTGIAEMAGELVAARDRIRSQQAELKVLRGLLLTPTSLDRCEHGTAMDVHCCNCHSGFIFDLKHVCEPAK